MTPRQIRRAAERRQRKLEMKMQRSSAMTARPDEPAVLSEAKIQEEDPAERRQRKLARKADHQNRAASANDVGAWHAKPELVADSSSDTGAHHAEPDLVVDPAPPHLSPAQLLANRANAQLSTGPTSADGKAKSSLNAVKTGLTGRTVLLPTDDAAAYQQHLAEFFAELDPVGIRERALVQSLADTAWRLDRIPALEMNIFALGRIQFAKQFDDHDPASRAGLIEAHIFLIYEKQLRNLQLQQARLLRQREKETAELRQLQQERIQKEKQDLETAAKIYTAAQHDKKNFDPAEFGFEFSIADVEAYLAGVRAANLLNASLKRDYQQARAQQNAA